MGKLRVDHRMVTRDQHDKIVSDVHAPDFAAAYAFVRSGTARHARGPDGCAAARCARCEGFVSGLNGRLSRALIGLSETLATH
jgi:hypothetical protein